MKKFTIIALCIFAFAGSVRAFEFKPTLSEVARGFSAEYETI